LRAGLEREALLLSSFLTATQSVLADLEKTKGGAGELLAMGADLLGGAGGSAAPKAADVNAFGEAVKSAIAPVNADLITYQNVHKAVDLHQVRAGNYRAFLEKLLAPPASDRWRSARRPWQFALLPARHPAGRQGRVELRPGPRL
jgi:hypothetical protein